MLSVEPGHRRHSTSGWLRSCRNCKGPASSMRPASCLSHCLWALVRGGRGEGRSPLFEQTIAGANSDPSKLSTFLRQNQTLTVVNVFVFFPESDMVFNVQTVILPNLNPILHVAGTGACGRAAPTIGRYCASPARGNQGYARDRKHWR